MDIKKDFRVELKKYPTNLYRDDKMKTLIQYFLNEQQRVALNSVKHSKAPQVAALEAICGGMKKNAQFDSKVSLSNFEFSFAKKNPT